jgi:hypothetical protein
MGYRPLGLGIVLLLVTGCSTQPTTTAPPKRLTHEEALLWIADHRAWRVAKKTKPMWVRPLLAGEVGKEFHTADNANETAREGYWLCVGVVGEPWFQKPERVGARYDKGDEETKQFPFDDQPRKYTIYRPRGDVLNWAACVDGPGIEGFYIRPGYDKTTQLYSPAGGYVVKDHVPEPYQDNPDDVWLVQKSIFDSTYELLP